MSSDYPNASRRPALAAHRQRKGISLHQIAASTKISVRFLQAIEESKFDLLPGGIYNTNYIRQYARAIGFEEGKLLEYYRSMMPVSV